MNFRKASSEIDWANQPAPGSKDTMTTRHQDPIPDGTAACRWHNACLHVHQSIHTITGDSHEPRKPFPESSSPFLAGISDSDP